MDRARSPLNCTSLRSHIIVVTNHRHHQQQQRFSILWYSARATTTFSLALLFTPLEQQHSFTGPAQSFHLTLLHLYLPSSLEAFAVLPPPVEELTIEVCAMVFESTCAKVKFTFPRSGQARVLFFSSTSSSSCSLVYSSSMVAAPYVACSQSVSQRVSCPDPPLPYDQPSSRPHQTQRAWLEGL